MEVPARYGLRFYTGVEVERATLAPQAQQIARPAAPHDVCRELGESPHPVLLTSAAFAGAATRALVACRQPSATRLDRVGRYVLIEPSFD